MSLSYGMLKESSLGHTRRDVKTTEKKGGGGVRSPQLASLVDTAENRG